MHAHRKTFVDSCEHRIAVHSTLESRQHSFFLHVGVITRTYRTLVAYCQTHQIRHIKYISLVVSVHCPSLLWLLRKRMSFTVLGRRPVRRFVITLSSTLKLRSDGALEACTRSKRSASCANPGYWGRLSFHRDSIPGKAQLAAPTHPEFHEWHCFEIGPCSSLDEAERLDRKAWSTWSAYPLNNNFSSFCIFPHHLPGSLHAEISRCLILVLPLSLTLCFRRMASTVYT